MLSSAELGRSIQAPTCRCRSCFFEGTRGDTKQRVATKPLYHHMYLILAQSPHPSSPLSPLPVTMLHICMYVNSKISSCIRCMWFSIYHITPHAPASIAAAARHHDRHKSGFLIKKSQPPVPSVPCMFLYRSSPEGEPNQHDYWLVSFTNSSLPENNN